MYTNWISILFVKFFFFIVVHGHKNKTYCPYIKYVSVHLFKAYFLIDIYFYKYGLLTLKYQVFLKYCSIWYYTAYII